MICNQICQACFGDIQFKSDYGKGSKFTVSFFIQDDPNGSRAQIESIDISEEQFSESVPINSDRMEYQPKPCFNYIEANAFD